MSETDLTFKVMIPTRGTISEVIVHSGCPEGRRVITLDPPLRIEPGATVMLPLTPAVDTQAMIEKMARAIAGRECRCVGGQAMNGTDVMGAEQ